MALIFVNLKRFDVPRANGGICPSDDPSAWIADVIARTVNSEQAGRDGVEIIYLLPEGLLLPATTVARPRAGGDAAHVHIGSQGVFREDVRPSGNFGAFTTNLPAAAARNLGAKWTIIGHSEERKDKLGILTAYDGEIERDADRRDRARATVDALMNAEAHRAMEAGLDVLFCVGETEEEQPRVAATLEAQVRRGLDGLGAFMKHRRLVLGYEPIWAIGPGKTPPGGDYIDFVAGVVKRSAREVLGMDVVVVYGGGLKAANAREIGAVPRIDGGLVALTHFTDPIGFDPGDLAEIIDLYLEAAGEAPAPGGDV